MRQKLLEEIPLNTGAPLRRKGLVANGIRIIDRCTLKIRKSRQLTIETKAIAPVARTVTQLRSRFQHRSRNDWMGSGQIKFPNQIRIEIVCFNRCHTLGLRRVQDTKVLNTYQPHIWHELARFDYLHNRISAQQNHRSNEHPQIVPSCSQANCHQRRYRINVRDIPSIPHISSRL